MQEVKPNTISQLLGMYLPRKHITQATIAETQNAFRTLIATAGDIKPSCLTSDIVEDFQTDLSGSGLSPATVNKYLRTLRPVFRWGQRRRWCEDVFVEIRKLKEPKKEIVIYELDELQRILAVCDKIWRLRFLLAVTAGMRRSEILNLTVADVDFERQCIYVRPKQRTATTWQWQPKDKDVRIVPLEEQTEKCLVDIIAEMSPTVPYVCVPEERYRYLIAKTDLSERVRICPVNNYTRMQKAILRRAGVIHKTFHDLRRTCGTQWSEHLPIHAVRDLLGHSDVNTTIKYYTKTRDRFLADAKKVSTLFLTGDTRC